MQMWFPTYNEYPIVFKNILTYKANSCAPAALPAFKQYPLNFLFNFKDQWMRSLQAFPFIHSFSIIQMLTDGETRKLTDLFLCIVRKIKRIQKIVNKNYLFLTLYLIRNLCVRLGAYGVWLDWHKQFVKQ